MPMIVLIWSIGQTWFVTTEGATHVVDFRRKYLLQAFRNSGRVELAAPSNPAEATLAPKDSEDRPMENAAENLPSLNKASGPLEDAKKLNRGNASRELVFGVVGHVGSGTTEIAKLLKAQLDKPVLRKVWGQDVGVKLKWDTHLIKASDVIAQWVKEIGEEADSSGHGTIDRAEQLQDFGDKMRETKSDHSAVARGMIHYIRKCRARAKHQKFDLSRPVEPDGKHRAYILDSLRHPAEVNVLRQLYGDAFLLVGVVCTKAVRLDRLQNRKFDGTSRLRIEEFMKRDAKAPEAHGQKVTDTFHLSDYFIGNSVDKAENSGEAINGRATYNVPEEIARIVDIASHHPSAVIRPTDDEKAMYAAAGAAMESACLSRQVGAAVIDRAGNVISTGANEVPKAGGGVYGRSLGRVDSKRVPMDRRCFIPIVKDSEQRRPYCSNTLEQNIIAEEIVKKLVSLFELPNDKEKEEEAKRKILKGRVGDMLEFSRAVHAEMDALLEAGRKGASTVGTRVFVTTFPCHYCARHLVSAGVDEVQFIEPYPKSLASKLHNDSIQFELDDNVWRPPSSGEGAKVLFRAFTGVAPRMFQRAFREERKMKDKESGAMAISEPDWGSPFAMSYRSYPQFEVSLADGVFK